MMRKLIYENIKKLFCFVFGLSPFADLDFEIFFSCKNKKKSYFIFFELSPFADFDFENV